jgi:hypothetical protein
VKTVIQDSCGHGLDSNRTPQEEKSEALPLEGQIRKRIFIFTAVTLNTLDILHATGYSFIICIVSVGEVQCISLHITVYSCALNIFSGVAMRNEFKTLRL